MTRTVLIVLGVLVAFILWFIFLAPGTEYPEADTRDVDANALFAEAEKLLADSESWPTELESEGVAVSSSLEPYPVRTVRYAIEVDGEFEDAIEWVRNENYSGPGRRDRPELAKWEATLYQKDGAEGPVEWVRRSVHIAPPPGGNRDAVVLYFEDRPDPNTYRIAFQSVETIDGKEPDEVENAVRFKVLPGMYKVEQKPNGKVLVRKIEAVDPRGAMSTMMNNYFISFFFFRNYMFEQAQVMREDLSRSSG